MPCYHWNIGISLYDVPSMELLLWPHEAEVMAFTLTEQCNANESLTAETTAIRAPGSRPCTVVVNCDLFGILYLLSLPGAPCNSIYADYRKIVFFFYTLV